MTILYIFIGLLFLIPLVVMLIVTLATFALGKNIIVYNKTVF
jgi:hypothetical protein